MDSEAKVSGIPYPTRILERHFMELCTWCSHCQYSGVFIIVSMAFIGSPAALIQAVP